MTPIGEPEEMVFGQEKTLGYERPGENGIVDREASETYRTMKRYYNPETGKLELPPEVERESGCSAEAVATRVGALDANVHWKHLDNAQGCNVRYGIAPDKLYLSWMVYGTDEVTLSTLIAGQEYYICVDAFNENGITPGKVIRLEA